MIDFTSALFLGYRHPSASFSSGWRSYTTGRPPVMGEPASGRMLAESVARAQGAGGGVLMRSTLHALIDVLATLTHRGDTVLIDENAYAVTRWAAGIASVAGVNVRRYRHHDASHAARLIGGKRSGRKCVVIADGWCPSCVQPAPLRELSAVCSAAGGHLVVDDSLGAGVVGTRSRRCRSPLGAAGLGTPAWLGLRSSNLVWVASAAKAWGSPVALLTGPDEVVECIRGGGPTRIHTSGPSHADLTAAALAIADTKSEQRRIHLAETIERVRTALERLDRPAAGLPFPVVVLDDTHEAAQDLFGALRQRGIRPLLTSRPCARRVGVTVLLRADHTERELDELIRAVRAACTTPVRR